jgi:hypothetical protein
MEADTSTPTAKPCIALATKKRIFSRGLTATAATTFHTVFQRNAPAISGFGGARSVSEPETVTDKPEASENAPRS